MRIGALLRLQVLDIVVRRSFSRFGRYREWAVSIERFDLIS